MAVDTHPGVASAAPARLHAPPRASLAYRADIEGLRGLAVLLVIAYHFGLGPVRGGYIGVDVFFVISGYLITSLLDREAGFFVALGDFYTRRLKRLLPMFVFFAAVTTIAAAALLLPDDFIAYLKSLREALLFRSNRFFDAQIKDYFGPNARQLPLLHTWSLGVEWQFYLGFPPVYLLLRHLLPRRAGTACLLVAFVGLAAYSIAVTHDSTDVYFSTAARLFELLAGALATRLAWQPGAPVARAVVGAAVVALLGLAVGYDAQTAFPGLDALWVVAAASVVVLFGKGDPWLGARPLAGLGQISYSAYLWHWPVVAFLSYLQLEVGGAMRVVLVVLVLLAAALSHAFIETPGRRLPLRLGSAVGVLFLAPLLISMGLLRWASLDDGFPARLGAEAARVHATLRAYAQSVPGECHGFRETDPQGCVFGVPGAPVKALLIGDSHARHYWAFVDALARAADVEVTGRTASECLMLPHVSLQFRQRPYPECGALTERYFERIRAGEFSDVFLADRWVGYPAEQFEHLEEALRIIIAAHARPIILLPVPEDGTDKKACFYRHIKLRRAQADDCSIDRDNDFVRPAKARVAARFAELAARYPELVLIDPQPLLCQERRCATVVDGVPLYDDTHHINAFASALLARRYLALHPNPLGANGPAGMASDKAAADEARASRQGVPALPSAPH